MGGEGLGAEGLAEDDRVDRLVDDLLEARHVDPGLARVEVDEALELGEVERPGVAAGAVTRITFSTPRTPTRVRLTSVAGRPDWTSGVVGERTWLASLTGTRRYRAGGAGPRMESAGACVQSAHVAGGTSPILRAP